MRAFTFLLTLALSFIAFDAAAASEPSKIHCQYDNRSHDGDAQEMTLERMGSGRRDLYSVSIVSHGSPWVPRKAITFKTGENLLSFSCSFSAKYEGVFFCSEVTADGFAGEKTLTSEISRRGVYRDAYRIELTETKDDGKYVSTLLHDTLFPISDEKPLCSITY